MAVPLQFKERTRGATCEERADSLYGSLRLTAPKTPPSRVPRVLIVP